MMISEVAILNIIEGQQAAFEKDFEVASQYISSIEGYVKHTLMKCVEKENQYLLLVEWISVEAHEIGFRQSLQYQKWKELLHHYYIPFPVVQHYKTLLLNDSTGS